MEYIEENHVSKDSNILLKILKRYAYNQESKYTNFVDKITIKVEDFYYEDVAILGEYWIKLSEYLIIRDAIKNINIQDVESLVLIYTLGLTMSKETGEKKDYYELEINIKYK